jgi:hypothetical protein
MRAKGILMDIAIVIALCVMSATAGALVAVGWCSDAQRASRSLEPSEAGAGSMARSSMLRGNDDAQGPPRKGVRNDVLRHARDDRRAICVLIGLVTWHFAVSCFVVVFLSFVTISIAVTGNRQKYDDPTKE